VATANRRQYGRHANYKNSGVNILLEEQGGWHIFDARIIDQSEGGVQILASSVDIPKGSFVVIKAIGGSWPDGDRKASAKVVWVSSNEEKKHIGCEYISPLTGIPEFF